MVAVIPVGTQGEELARRLSAAGIPLVLVADDGTAEVAGRLASELGGRVTVFVGIDGVVEFVQELFGVQKTTI